VFEEVAELAADQDERGGDQGLKRDRALDRADRHLEIPDHRRDRHEIDTFINDVSTTRTNIAAASTSDKRVFLAIRSSSVCHVPSGTRLHKPAAGRAGHDGASTPSTSHVLGSGQVAYGEPPCASRHQERQCPQRRLDPRLVGHHGNPLEVLGVTGAEAGVGLHGVGLDVVGARPEEVEEPHLAPRGEFTAQHGFDHVLLVVVIHLADRLEADGSGRHVGHPPQHAVLRSFGSRVHMASPGREGDARAMTDRGHHPLGMMPARACCAIVRLGPQQADQV
jgi:hypothetical protein